MTQSDAITTGYARFTLGPDTLDDALQAARAADIILLSSVDAFRDAGLLEVMRRVALTERPAIGLALGLPYDAESLPEIGSYLAAYDYSQPALAAAASVLFGDG